MVDLPIISVVTPCLNQVNYVAKTIESIRDQNYPFLEHIVMDGGSTDGSLEIIQSYEGFLSWTSAPDGGQYSAIAAGLSGSRGEVMCWLNSDDVYITGALRTVGEIFREFPQVEWLTTRFPMAIDANGAVIKMNSFPGFSKKQFLSGDNLPASGWEASGFIQQESTFWRRSLWNRTGACFAPGYDFAGDFELWTRFFAEAELFSVDVPLGCFRRHDTQKSATDFQRYLDEAARAFTLAGGKVPRTWIQKNRMRLLEASGASYALRRRLRSFGVLASTTNVTYDWGRACWSFEG